MHGWRLHVEMKALLEAGLSKSATAKRLGVNRRTVDRRKSVAAGSGESQAAGAEVGSVPGDRARPSGGVSGADVATAVRRGSGGGLPGQLQSGTGLRAEFATCGAATAGTALRDAAGASGSGGLRHVSDAVGSAACLGGGVGPLAADVV